MYRTDAYYGSGAIFDIRWSPCDKKIALASARRLSYVISTETGQTTAVLLGHYRSQKAVRWHPHNSDILYTGSRDGSICMWDLRQRTNGEASPVVQIWNAHLYLDHRRAGTITDVMPVDDYTLYSSSSCDRFNPLNLTVWIRVDNIAVY